MRLTLIKKTLTAFDKLHRSYPSLNLMIHVSKDQHTVQVVLPGLRFDDIDHTGQPNIVTVFDMLSHVETAAYGHEYSFLDYRALRQQNLRTYVKACVMDIGSDFYETTTPKAPLDVCVKLTDIGHTTFTTVNEVFCGGRLKPSIRVRSVHGTVNKMRQAPEPLPEWWVNRFRPLLPTKNQKIFITPEAKIGKTHKNVVTVPLTDTDHNERTRCASYLKYFTENSSIALRKEALAHIKSSFNMFHTKRLNLLYMGPTKWGDILTSETWQGENKFNIYCSISKGDHQVWFGKMELFEDVFGLQPVVLKA